ncbi:hypothetical protein E2562_037541, partial [Oryza meyeriana var. granulata]
PQGILRHLPRNNLTRFIAPALDVAGPSAADRSDVVSPVRSKPSIRRRGGRRLARPNVRTRGWRRRRLASENGAAPDGIGSLADSLDRTSSESASTRESPPEFAPPGIIYAIRISCIICVIFCSLHADMKQLH